METGTPGIKSTKDGWLNRLLVQVDAADQRQHSPFSAVSMTQQMPRALLGKYPALAISNLQRFGIQGQDKPAIAAANGFESLWSDHIQASSKEVAEAFDAIQMLRRSGATTTKADPSARYPTSSLGNALRQLAQIRKADLGLRIGFVDAGGWDTHINQGNGANGVLSRRLQDLASSLAAFDNDLQQQRKNTLVVVMSEFGRTVAENGSRGTDHGHGNVMLLLGDAVNGGRVAGDWPGLSKEKLFEERDLAITTDYRLVLSETIGKYFSVTTDGLDRVFPNFTANRSDKLKLFG